jgi:hypothetical protein
MAAMTAMARLSRPPMPARWPLSGKPDIEPTAVNGARICNGLGIMRACLETQKLEQLEARMEKIIDHVPYTRIRTEEAELYAPSGANGHDHAGATRMISTDETERHPNCGNIQAIRELADRLDGKPVQQLEPIAAASSADRRKLTYEIVHVNEAGEQINNGGPVVDVDYRELKTVNGNDHADSENKPANGSGHEQRE